MPRDRNRPDNSHPADQKFLSQVDEYGWKVTNVFLREGETGPEWSYSTGLFQTYKHPEIVIFGLELDNMKKIVNTIGDEVKSRLRFATWERMPRHFARCSCQFRIVDHGFHRDYLGWANWYYNGDPFPVLPCFWPDRQG